MQNSAISWTDHTFNPWIGCTKVSHGCLNCYAEARDQRFAKGIHWGKGAPRQRTSESNWRAPLKWNREAERAYVDALHCTPDGQVCAWSRPRVFCASLADWLDDEVPIEWLADLLKLIHDTPNLDWQLLTKRPENWFVRLRAAAGRMSRSTEARWADVGRWIVAWLERDSVPDNIWLGTSVEDQSRADERIPALLDIPARVRFLSCEPLLGPVDLKPRPSSDLCIRCGEGPHAPHNHRDGYRTRGIDWVICGGESGPNARPMHPEWVRTLRDQCQAAGVPFHFKQWGEYRPFTDDEKAPQQIQCHTFHEGPNVETVYRVGKHAAGRLLDDREWNEFPDRMVI